MKPYAEYKETHLDWLPRVPKHWEVKKGKRIFKRVVREVRPDDEVVTAFRDGQVTLRKNRRLSGFTESNKEIGYQGIRKGDLVIHAMDAFAGAIGVSDSDGKSTPVYSACIAINGDNAFYFSSLLRYISKTGYLESLAKGIRERSTDFRFEQFANLRFVVPPLAEQQRIVSYLAAKNREIESYIAAKRALLLRLKELSAAVISRAVTRGLNPAVETKPSGVEWLGHVPKHWNVKRLKFVVEINPTKSQGAFTKNPQDTCVFLPMETISANGKILRQEMKPVGEVSEGFTYFEKSDVVVAKITPCFENGKGAYLESLESPFGFGTTEFHVLRPKKSMLGDFLYFVTASRTFRVVGAENMTGSAGQKRVPTSFIANYPIPLPPLEEQREIVAFIENKLATIREAQGRIEREIELARELWTTLVAEVVTGQADVSDWDGADQCDAWEMDTALRDAQAELSEEETVFAED